jgi:hypothetical protein
MEYKHELYFGHCPLSQAKRSQTFQRQDLSPASDGKADTENLLRWAMYIETITFLKIIHHCQNASKVGGMILTKETNLPCRGKNRYAAVPPYPQAVCSKIYCSYVKLRIIPIAIYNVIFM